jgi:hypothetical protein
MKRLAIVLVLAAAASAGPETEQKLLVNAGSGDIGVRAAALREITALPAPDQVKVLLRGLRHYKAESRLSCAWALGGSGDQRTLGSLARAAIYDDEEGVRRAAVQSMKRIGHEDLAFPFHRALNSEDSAIRVRAAEALGAIGDPRSVEYLLKVYTFAGGGSPRVNIFVGTQTTYIQDYDAQVAQAAAIADPKIGLIQSGAVLDARVVGVYGSMTVLERRTLVRSLEKITGKTYGDSVPAWRSWLAWWKSGAPEPGKAPDVQDPPTADPVEVDRDTGYGRRYYFPRGRAPVGTGGDCGARSGPVGIPTTPRVPAGPVTPRGR